MLPTPPETVPLPEKRDSSDPLQYKSPGPASSHQRSGKFVHHTANAQIPHSKLDHHIAGGQLKLRL